jgi:hypothetical protein
MTFKTYHSKHCHCNDCLISYPVHAAPPPPKPPAPSTTTRAQLLAYAAAGTEFTINQVTEECQIATNRDTLNRILHSLVKRGNLKITRRAANNTIVYKGVVIHE